MALRCSNCGAPLVLPSAPPPFVTCRYCQGTIPVPGHLQATSVAPPPPPARSGKLKYALGGAGLLLVGALLGPLANGLSKPEPPSGGTPLVVATVAPAARGEVPGSPPEAAPAQAAATATAARAADDRPVVVDKSGLKLLGGGKADPAPRALASPLLPTAAGAPIPAHTAAPAASTPPVPTNVRVSMGSPALLYGTYEVAAIRRILSQASSTVRTCYTTALAIKPGFSVALDVRFHINSDGSVSGAGVYSPPPTPSNMISCINRTIGGLHFPPPTPTDVRAQTTVTLATD